MALRNVSLEKNKHLHKAVKTEQTNDNLTILHYGKAHHINHKQNAGSHTQEI